MPTNWFFADELYRTVTSVFCGRFLESVLPDLEFFRLAIFVPIFLGSSGINNKNE